MFRKPAHERALENVIAEIADEMRQTPTTSDEFDTMMDRMEKLHKLKKDNRKERVSPDTLAVVVGNLAGIVVIVGYERAHVATSKALSFVLKAR